MKTLMEKLMMNLNFFKKGLVKNQKFLTVIALFTLWSFSMTAQVKVGLGAKFGYDQPLFNMPYQELNYKGHRYIGGHLDVQFANRIGIRADYANILTRPNIKIPASVFYGTTGARTLQSSINVKRNWVGMGPSYTFGGGRFSVLTSPMVGYSWIKGGDAMMTATNPTSGSADLQLLNTGFDDRTVAAKMDVDFNFDLTKNLRLTVGTYYMRHFNVDFDEVLDINNTIPSIYHGENTYDQTIAGFPYTVTTNPPNVISKETNENCCKDLSSVGVNVGLSVRFGGGAKKVEEPIGCCGCPDDQHKIVVTVRDEISGKVIPKADVALKDMTGNIVSTGTTNNFGVVDFGEISHGDYIVVGDVFGIATTTETVRDAEFTPGAIIQKEVLYQDLRFILKGKTFNKGTRQVEPNTIVSLTDKNTGSVKQDNSDSQGAFTFRLDKSSSYQIVGNKENRLSEIEGVSTMGLNRSTTLFVDLELGMDDFDCGVGTVLDIKYEYDKWFLTPSAKFELDRIVIYLNDHRDARLELSSHTDSRGNNNYNLDLSEKRANSAVTYILSKGVSRNRLVARGYGEERLKNRCGDGVPCTEAEHKVNRRTEAKLICR